MKLILQIILLSTSVLLSETRDKADAVDKGEENFTLGIAPMVVSEIGEPIEGATVQVSIENSNDFIDGSNDICGETNKNGEFRTEGIGRPVAEIRVTKKGYYPSTKTYTEWGNIEETRKTGKYIPWNPVIELKLKKIGNPIPMIVRYGSEAWVQTTPTPGQEIGFDLFEYDWVAPHGKGKIPDLMINLSLVGNGEQDSAVLGIIGFSNLDDGLIPVMELSAPESLLKYPRSAAKEGYLIKQVKPPVTSPFTKIPTRVEAKIQEPVGYIFRIRTQKDKMTGKIISAYYGKITIPDRLLNENKNPFILHRFSFSNPDRKLIPGVKFEYFLNPTPNDRNIEFDQENNLVPEAIKGSVYPP